VTALQDILFLGPITSCLFWTWLSELDISEAATPTKYRCDWNL